MKVLFTQDVLFCIGLHLPFTQNHCLGECGVLGLGLGLGIELPTRFRASEGITWHGIMVHLCRSLGETLACSRHTRHTRRTRHTGTVARASPASLPGFHDKHQSLYILILHNTSLSKTTLRDFLGAV